MLKTPPRTREPSPWKTEILKAGITPSRAQQALLDWNRLRDLRTGPGCLLDGDSLEISDIVAVAKYGVQAALSADPQITQGISRSIETLQKQLDEGHLVYGVTTGFGGSASTRTSDLESLQRALIQHQNAGVLSSKDIGRPQLIGSASSPRPNNENDADFDIQSQPTAWVRAAMLTRCNSIVRGHSAVRKDVIDTILALLNHNITPVVPLRGSISASGDLSPLSYIAGAIEGNPDIFVRCGQGSSRIVTAQEALRQAKIEPVTLHAKEGLGLLNGTAFSAGTASLALSQAQDMTILSQILTSMGVEALTGTAESFWPRIAEMRPHPGQIECAANVLAFLSGSKLAKCVDKPKDTKATGLYQDRYAIRTAPQWIGPQIEDLAHAMVQIKRELNSTTDNPLIDTGEDRVLHGGNFQAAIVTSTMDRTRLCLEKLGRMLFAQGTEIINPMLNNGLPGDLASDDPSLSFTCKGIDITLASYASELGFLANPVGNHVMSAEMHNQAINSIALISSRYTFQALDVLHIMSSACLFVLCQALDLRVLQMEFLKAAEVDVQRLTTAHFEDLPSGEREVLYAAVWSKVTATWPTTTTLDLTGRCSKTADTVVEAVVRHLASSGAPSQDLSRITSFMTTLSKTLSTAYDRIRKDMYSNHLSITTSYLGQASRRMYMLVRKNLGVRFHRGLVEHPTQPAQGQLSAEEAAERKTIGSQISIIYEALKDGRVIDTLTDIVEERLKV